VPLQGGYVAKRCPVRAQNDHDLLVDVRRVEVSEAVRARLDAGIAFEGEVVDAILAESVPGSAVSVPPGHAGAMEQATTDAMGRGDGVIVGGSLPNDLNARRTGRPDVLVRVGSEPGPDGRWRYIPADIKHHSLAASHSKRSTTWSSLGRMDPLDPNVEPGTDLKATYLRDDGFQLAHYWRMLEAVDRTPDAAVLAPIGGIIDRGHVVRWIDLAEPRFTRWWSDELVSLLDWYDFEFAFRLDVIARTLQRNDQPALPRAVTPVQVPECGSCPWHKVCERELDQTDHVSLLPRTTWETFVHHRRHGLISRRAMAELDWRTAWVMQGSSASDTVYDLSSLHRSAETVPAETAITALVGKRSRTLLQRLADTGIHTAGDVAALDPRTAALPAKGAGHLPTLIDQARAAVSDRPFRTRGCTQIDVPRADIEIDLDMENTADGVYLWGTLTTLRSAAGTGAIAEGYEPLIDWDDPPGRAPGAEARLLQRLQSWLAERRAFALAHGLTIRIYCWSGAEAAQIRRVVRTSATTDDDDAVDRTPTKEWADELLSPPLWVDLFDVFRDQVITGGGAGLKLIAPLAGFAWRDDDPGGDQSQLWYRQAIDDPDPLVRTALRQRLLDYNEDDVNATQAIRNWLDREGRSFPSVEDWT